MVYPAGNPLPSNPGGVPVAGNTPVYTPAVQLPAAAQPPAAVPPVAVPPVAVPPQTWSPDTTQFSQQAIQAATAPQPQATVVPASNPQGYTQLWAQAPQTDLWQAEWKNGQSAPPQAPPVVMAPPVVVPPVVQTPVPQPAPPPVMIPVPQPAPPPVVTPPVAQPPATPAPTPAPAEPPKPDSAPAPVGSLPQAPEPEPAPVYPDPPNETPAPLGGLPDVAEPEPAPEPEPEPPSVSTSRLGGLPTIEEPEPQPPAKPEPEPQAEVKPAPKPAPKPPAKPDGITGRSWKVVADPHVTTGDGQQFDAALAGRFTLIRSADGKFEVQNKQDQIPGDRGIWNTALTVKSHSDTVTYDAASQTLTVNEKKVAFKAGTKIKLPDGGRLEMTNSEYSPGKFAPRVQVVTPEGDRVAFLILQRKNGGRYVDLYGNIGAKRQPGEMNGMVGAFDADSKAENDLKLRNGKTASSVDDFLKDWKLS